ncbi:MAG: LPS-assembly protein LptD, partial [Stenotrophomonas sp.]
MRRALRLLPLPLSIAICLPAMADDKPMNWGLCPATDTLPAFDEAPPADPAAAANREQLPTDIEGNELTGTSAVPQYQGNVLIKRGDQFMGADSLRLDTESGN